MSGYDGRQSISLVSLTTAVQIMSYDVIFHLTGCNRAQDYLEKGERPYVASYLLLI